MNIVQVSREEKARYNSPFETCWLYLAFSTGSLQSIGNVLLFKNNPFKYQHNRLPLTLLDISMD